MSREDEERKGRDDDGVSLAAGFVEKHAWCVAWRGPSNVGGNGSYLGSYLLFQTLWIESVSWIDKQLRGEAR